MKKYILPVLFFGFFLNINAAASMVSFHVIETGLQEGRASNEHSIQWENALMDVFFNAGHIVSNAPIIHFDVKPQGNILNYAGIDIIDARIWGIDYILIAQLDFQNELQSPANISLFIYKVNNNEKILERQIEGKTYRSTRDEYNDISSIIISLIPYFSS